ncbi:LANO_0A01024g1_1 [Lachancea nothofagi CBS 11611]|uniref:LANO_0A01024g1_1 n=1 Tax=Lachancea nothofagi CBS 11611 TaxID=1266666 RepID=A0A1G4IMR7_9SACH|nr:LANO_0A01024g1_1 [Lachancea nothofagi CBS 11611]
MKVDYWTTVSQRGKYSDADSSAEIRSAKRSVQSGVPPLREHVKGAVAIEHLLALLLKTAVCPANVQLGQTTLQFPEQISETNFPSVLPAPKLQWPTTLPLSRYSSQIPQLFFLTSSDEHYLRNPFFLPRSSSFTPAATLSQIVAYHSQSLRPLQPASFSITPNKHRYFPVFESSTSSEPIFFPIQRE